MKIKNKTDLRLFTDSEGVTWCRNDVQRASPFSQSLDELLCGDEIMSAERIRILGFPSNASLICELWERRDDTFPEVQIGTPAVCSPVGQNEDPDVVFRQMQSLTATPASLGGMRPITKYDYMSYCLVEWVQQGEVPSVDQVAGHPAWPAVSFVLNQICPAPDDCLAYDKWETLPAYSAAINVLASILDPRWFVDWQHPDRLARMKMYMGIAPKYMRSAWQGVPGTGLRDFRAKMVLDVWSNGERRKPSKSVNSFLWGLPTVELGGDVLALRASGMYLSFIRSVWLHMMRRDGRTLFVPEYFFPSKKDAEAYERHQLLWEVDYDEI